MIVIFGAAVLQGGRPSRTLQARVEAAFACGGPGGRYIATGAVGRNPPSEARVMAELLARLGVPKRQITLEETATDTLSSAVACARLLAGEPGPVRVASSGYHLPRCLMLMRMAGVRAAACPPPPRPRSAWNWLREAAALPCDAVLMATRRATHRRPANSATGGTFLPVITSRKPPMSIFGSIMSKIFHHPAASGPGAVEQAPPVATDTTVQQPAPEAVAPPPGGTPFDVGGALADMASKSGQALNYKTSIVDLLKLLGLDSSMDARKALAGELHYTGSTEDSATMNIWLHKAVMQKLEENGGVVPADLKGG